MTVRPGRPEPPGPEIVDMGSRSDEMLRISESCHMCRCGCCKDDCPMYSEIMEETMSPKGRNAVIRAVSKGVIQPDERVVRIAFSCLLCRRDEQSCTAELANSEVAEWFREYLVERGIPLLPEHETLVKSLGNYGNPWQESKTARKRWAKDLRDRKVVRGKTSTLFYVGCTFALDRALQESPRALVSLMLKAGEDFGLLLEDEVCCGSSAKRIGHTKTFRKLRQENERRIRDSGVKRVVTACSGCYKTLKQDYPGLPEDIHILHSTEYLLDLVRTHRLRFKPADVKVTYHDPCHLGRHAGVFSQPREILKAVPGLKLIEMENCRELSRCCGGGAGVKTAYPELSMKAAVRRVKEAEETGAEIVVTACPFCVQTLKNAIDAERPGLQVKELSVFLDEIAEGGDGAKT